MLGRCAISKASWAKPSSTRSDALKLKRFVAPVNCGYQLLRHPRFFTRAD